MRDLRPKGRVNQLQHAWDGLDAPRFSRTAPRTYPQPPLLVEEAGERPVSLVNWLDARAVHVVAAAGAVARQALLMPVKGTMQGRLRPDVVAVAHEAFLGALGLVAFFGAAFLAALVAGMSSRSPVILSALPAAMVLHLALNAPGCEPVTQALARLGAVVSLPWLRQVAVHSSPVLRVQGSRRSSAQSRGGRDWSC